jgi:hypothetical protein
MARKTKFTPYGEEIAEYDDEIAAAFDEDAGSSEFMSYRYAPSTARQDDFPPHDPMPLFLSGQRDEPREPTFGISRDKAAISGKIVKVSLVAASVAAIAFSVLSVENPLALFANAKASLIGISASQSSTGQPASANQPAPSLQAAVDVRTLPMTVPETPTRDEIAAAFKSAHQSQPEIRQPEIRQLPAAAPPARRLGADELAALLKRARSLIAIGDIAPARLLLERAADAQEASAALLLAQTYDPAVLGTQDMRSITPDPAAARVWYQKAAQFGSPDAQQRLAQMP